MLREPRSTNKAEARAEEKKGRFRLVKLEERIAPVGKIGRPGSSLYRYPYSYPYFGGTIRYVNLP